MNRLRSVAILMVLALLGFNSCSQNDNILPAASDNRDKESSKLQLRQTIATLAKLLASDLNGNSQHRKELFSKIANRFDGDNDMLLRHFLDNTLENMYAASLSKISTQTKSSSKEENAIESSLSSIPNLQLMMPFMTNWTARKIQESGGLIVAMYPFDVQERKIEEIIGFDKNGREVTINKATAPTLPYVILSENERTDAEGYLKLGVVNRKTGVTMVPKLRSLQGDDPKYAEITSRENWEDVSLTSLRGLREIPNQVCLDCEGEGGGEGGGGSPPSPSAPQAGEKMYISDFRCDNVSYYEPYWFAGEPEFVVRVYFFGFEGNVSGYPVSFQTYTFKQINPNYDGDGGIFTHDYASGWRSAGDPQARPWEQGTYLYLAGIGNPSGVPLICPPFQVTAYEEDGGLFNPNDEVGSSYFNYTDLFPREVWLGSWTAIRVKSVP